MLKWNNKKNLEERKRANYRQRIASFVNGVNLAYKHNTVESFKFMKSLREHLYNFQVSSCAKFIKLKEYQEENLCQICLNPLLGPCSTFACDCKLTLHEGCMFRLILGGYNKCPQCNTQLSLTKYRPSINYPITLKIDLIQKELKNIIDDEDCKKNIRIENIIEKIKTDNIKDTNVLKQTYIS